MGTRLILRAIAQQDKDFCFDTFFGHRRIHRRIGEALHPTREPIETLEQLRQSLGPYHFAGEYQQAPAPLGGGMVRAEWFIPELAHGDSMRDSPTRG